MLSEDSVIEAIGFNNVASPAPDSTCFMWHCRLGFLSISDCLVAWAVKHHHSRFALWHCRLVVHNISDRLVAWIVERRHSRFALWHCRFVFRNISDRLG